MIGLHHPDYPPLLKRSPAPPQWLFVDGDATSAFGDPTRRDMVARLCAGDATVGELALTTDAYVVKPFGSAELVAPSVTWERAVAAEAHHTEQLLLSTGPVRP